MLECDLCGLPITEEDFENNNVMQTAFGNWHHWCVVAYEDERDERRGDEEYDRSIDT